MQDMRYESVEFEDDFMKCPSCNEIYLHQDKVEVWQRFEEDGPGRHTTISHGGDELLDVIDPRPPHRRDTIRIHFYCEHCHAGEDAWDGTPHVLEIYQHKGHTLANWYVDGERKQP